MRVIAALLLLFCTAMPAAAQGKVEPLVAKAGSQKRSFGKSYYLLNVPAAFARQKCGLVIGLHGSGGRPENYSGHYAPALSKGHIVMMPASNDPQGYDGADVKQIVEMVEEVVKTFGVDRDRILASGHSAGGFTSFYLAAARPDLFTAVGSVSAGTMVQGLDACKPIPFYIVSGKKDFNNKQATQCVEQMKKAGFEVTFEDPADWDHSPPATAWEHIFTWFDGLIAPADLAALQQSRAQIEKKQWGKAGAALRKLAASKTATAHAKRRAEAVGEGIALEGQKALDDAKASDEAGETKKAADALAKAKTAFDGSEIGERIAAMLAELKKKLGDK